MSEYLPFIERFGYLALFGLGFLEFAGLPIVTVPVLLAAGSLVAVGVLDPLWIILSVAAGGILSELGWFWMARRYGSRLTHLACGLSSNPTACVVSVAERVALIGAPYILLGKFIPGAANLIAPASGLAGMKTLRFAGLKVFTEETPLDIVGRTGPYPRDTARLRREGGAGGGSGFPGRRGHFGPRC